MKQIDCRKRENKSKMNCKVKRFCSKRENNVISAGKGLFALANPTVGTMIGAYETRKALIKVGVCEK